MIYFAAYACVLSLILGMVVGAYLTTLCTRAEITGILRESAKIREDMTLQVERMQRRVDRHLEKNPPQIVVLRRPKARTIVQMIDPPTPKTFEPLTDRA